MDCYRTVFIIFVFDFVYLKIDDIINDELDVNMEWQIHLRFEQTEQSPGYQTSDNIVRGHERCHSDLEHSIEW